MRENKDECDEDFLFGCFLLLFAIMFLGSCLLGFIAVMWKAVKWGFGL